jgi:hypothetical protein
LFICCHLLGQPFYAHRFFDFVTFSNSLHEGGEVWPFFQAYTGRFCPARDNK